MSWVTFTFTIILVHISYFLHNPGVMRITKLTLIFFQKYLYMWKELSAHIIGTCFPVLLIQEEISPIKSYEFREPEAKCNITFQNMRLNKSEPCVREVNCHSKDRTAALYLIYSFHLVIQTMNVKGSRCAIANDERGGIWFFRNSVGKGIYSEYLMEVI